MTEATHRTPTVGSSAMRLDAADKVTGTFVYGHDVSMPGQLVARLRRSDVPHARLLSVDVTEARSIPGVRAVLTAGDLGDLRGSRFVRDEPVLASDRVRYLGEPIAAVAADTVELAERALRAIDVEYEPLPVLKTPLESLADEAPLLHPDWESYWSAPIVRRQGNILNHVHLERGDVDAVFATADHIFEDRYDTSLIHQVSLEGRVAVASVDREGDVHVVTSHQFPFGLRQDLADILNIPIGRIRVTVSGLGGGFGGKLYAGVEHFCVLLSQATGRPVKLQHSREEEMTATSPRMGATVQVRTAVASDGTLLAREGTLHYDAGAYAESSPGVVGIGALTLPGPYRWQALRMDSYAVYTNKANCGSYRGPGAPQAVFAGESQLDRIAHELGIDPLQLRRRNAVEDGDLGPTGQVLRNVSLKETLDRAAEAIGWDQAGGPSEGRGLACCWWTTTGGASSAYLRVDEDGSVVLMTGATEIGTGAVQAGVAQICADELGMDVADLKLVTADTETTPYDFGAQGSRTAYQMGNAVIRAAADLKQQLFELAAEKLGEDPDRLALDGGVVRSVEDPDHQVSLADLAKLGQTRGGLLGRGSYIAPPTPYDESSVQGAMLGAFNEPSFSTHAARVEIDDETGQVELTAYVAVQDVGHVINPTYCAGQVTGGAVQGIGQALFEELRYVDGVVKNPNLTDYKLPTTMDVPTIQAILVEQPSDHGPYGAKGVGEPSVVPPPAAIANAIHDAVGIWVKALPITAERVLDGLDARHDGD
jgi:CO/xanthine dehydrogenase Mo-binding subunit